VLSLSSTTVDLVSAVAWPVVALATLSFFATNRGRLLLYPLLRRIRKLSGGGIAIELSAEAAGATKAEVEGTLRDYGAALDQEFQRLAYAHDVRDHLRAVIQEVFDAASGEGWDEPPYRSTVHVQDALFTGALYQLLDYDGSGANGGAGRRFSIRFGMLGRAWRLGKSVAKLDVPIDPEELIETWGMTAAQAKEAAKGRKSFVCIALKSSNDVSLLGVLYLDAKPANAFPQDIAHRFDEAQHLKSLREAVQKVHGEIAARGPGLKQFDHV
jgi:hypothetical protein